MVQVKGERSNHDKHHHPGRPQTRTRTIRPKRTRAASVNKRYKTRRLQESAIRFEQSLLWINRAVVAGRRSSCLRFAPTPISILGRFETTRLARVNTCHRARLGTKRIDQKHVIGVTYIIELVRLPVGIRIRRGATYSSTPAHPRGVDLPGDERDQS